MMWLLLAAALAGPGDVTEDLGSEVVLNWTTLQLEARAAARPRGAQSVAAVEESARRAVEARLRRTVGELRVTPSVSLQSVLDGPLSAPIESRLSRWTVSKAQYAASGSVTLEVELSVRNLLKPWTLSTAKPAPERTPEGSFTGLVVDARGLSLQPAFSLAITGPSGEVLYDGTLWDSDAVTEAPFVFVTDPAHPACARAGDRPLIVSASGVGRAGLTLAQQDASRVSESLSGAPLLGQGRVVLVVDPL